jgi:Rho family protein
VLYTANAYASIETQSFDALFNCQGERISKAIGARAYYECSSLLNQGVDDVFEAATRAAMLVRESGHGPSNPVTSRKEAGTAKQAEADGHGKRCCLIA